MVVAAYGLILPPAVLDLPRLGCLNIHASLLPRWRGAAAIQRAILAGGPAARPPPHRDGPCADPADALARAVRAYNPVPGAWTLLDGAPLKIWSAHVVAGSGAPKDADF